MPCCLSGGILGLGDKLFAVPWSALQVDEEEKCVIFDVDRRTLQTAPGFDKDDWPDMAGGTDIFQHHGAVPYWGEYMEEKALHGGGGA